MNNHPTTQVSVPSLLTTSTNLIIIPYGSNNLICSTVGIENIDNTSYDPLTISPNPSSHFLFLESEHKIFSLTVYNSFGEILIEKWNVNNLKTIIDLSSLPTSIYFMKVQTENGTFIERFIKL